MSIVNNIDSTMSHFQLFSKEISKSDELLIVSPFLMQDFSQFMKFVEMENIKLITIITTLIPNKRDQLLKINAFNSLDEFIVERKLVCNKKILINNKLHGKIYIFKSNGKFNRAYITSANFTDNGLSRSHEWGYILNDESEIKNLESQVLQQVEHNLDNESIEKMTNLVNEYLAKKLGSSKSEKIDLNLLTELPKGITITIPEDIDYWLKPMGVTGEPFDESIRFGGDKSNLHFAKTKNPPGVNLGDIVITYSVQIHKIISVFRINSEPKHVDKDKLESEPYLERWPWYVEGVNLTKVFGLGWPDKNILITRLFHEFKTNYPKDPVTKVGGFTLGGLNYGKDKLRLSLSFAEYLLSNIRKYDQ